MNILYPVALNEYKQPIHISDAKQHCDVWCPYCGGKMVARLGDIKVRHFAHTSGINCLHGYETSIHHLAKMILDKKRMINLPLVKHGNVTVVPSSNIEFDTVEIEPSEDGFRPDIRLSKNGISMYIEIAVTHKCDADKVRKLKAEHKNVLEIDLSNINRGIDVNSLENILLQESENKYWISNPKIETRLKQLKWRANKIAAFWDYAWEDYHCCCNMDIRYYDCPYYLCDGETFRDESGTVKDVYCVNGIQLMIYDGFFRMRLGIVG